MRQAQLPPSSKDAGNAVGSIIGAIFPAYGIARMAGAAQAKPLSESKELNETAVNNQNSYIAQNNPGMVTSKAPDAQNPGWGVGGEISDAAMPGFTQLMGGVGYEPGPSVASSYAPGSKPGTINSIQNSIDRFKQIYGNVYR